MQVLNCNTSVCKKITIPAPNKTISTPDITVVVDIPAGLKVASATVSHGVINNNIWTIASLPANEDGVLDICFNPADCEVFPTGKSGNVTVSTTANESNLANNVIPFTLEYTTCGDIDGCSDVLGIVKNDTVSTALMAFVVDEDDMVSDLDTKVPTQQSVKTFVEVSASDAGLFTGVSDWSADTFTGNQQNGIRASAGLYEGFIGVDTINSDVQMTRYGAFGSPPSVVSLTQGQAKVSADLSVTIRAEDNNTAVIVGSSGVSVSSDQVSFSGVRYGADYSADFTDRSLVDKEYVDGLNVLYAGALTVVTNGIGEGAFTITGVATVPPNILLTLTDGGEMRTIHLVSTVGNTVNFIAYNSSGPLNAASLGVNWRY